MYWPLFLQAPPHPIHAWCCSRRALRGCDGRDFDAETFCAVGLSAFFFFPWAATGPGVACLYTAQHFQPVRRMCTLTTPMPSFASRPPCYHGCYPDGRCSAGQLFFCLLFFFIDTGETFFFFLPTVDGGTGRDGGECRVFVYLEAFLGGWMEARQSDVGDALLGRRNRGSRVLYICIMAPLGDVRGPKHVSDRLCRVCCRRVEVKPGGRCRGILCGFLDRSRRAGVSRLFRARWVVSYLAFVDRCEYSILAPR